VVENGPVGSASRSSDRIVKMLGTIPLFAGLPPETLSAIARCARMRRVDAGEVVIERGDPPGALFAVATGKLKVVAPRSAGRDATLHILGPGEAFGEAALFQADGRTARVAALEESVLLAIDRADVMALLQRSTLLSGRLLELLARRLKATIAHFEATTSLDATQRLASKLLVLAEHFGVAEGCGVRLTVKLSQSELGDLVDSTRQTVNRQLRAWQQAGVLDTHDGRIRVIDLAALRNAARSE
jgi:CRP-like cAMP-binding protein